MSITEHNRWNIERLLTGFSAYKLKERLEFIDRLTSSDENIKKECDAMLKKNKKKYFIHKDIAPYDELIENSKKYDKYIVRNIPKVINP